MKKVIGIFLIASMGGFASISTYKYFEKKSPLAQSIEPFSPTVFTNSMSPVPANLDFTLAAERSVNAVVHVKTVSTMQAPDDPWMRFFGYEGRDQIQQGSGSGVIISQDGYIVTNNHVVNGAEEIQVSLNNNKTYSAEIIGTDPSTDIALLKIEGKNLPTMNFGDSNSLKVGEWVLAVGNPFNLTSTVTAGIVSAKARNIHLLSNATGPNVFPIESFIQTDAAVNPGNSGGALVDVDGNLIGINTAIASQTGSYTGYSFAIPATIVEKITKDLMEFGRVQRAFIGVTINNVNEELAKDLGLEEIRGVYVDALMNDGAAQKAGMEPGDVILKVGSTPVSNIPELQEQVSRYRPGDDVSIGIWRDGVPKSLKLTLRNRLGGVEIGHKMDLVSRKTLGAELQDLSELERNELGILGGAKIINIGSGALSTAGVKEGFVITKIDGIPTNDASETADVLKQKKGGVLIEGIYPNGDRAYYGMGL